MRSIVINYKNGSMINIDVPETFYADKYKNTSEKKLHKIFMKDYEKFVTALNKSQNVISVNKYLKFSNATISCENVLGVDIKILDKDNTASQSKIKVPGVYDKTYLDISETSLNALISKIEESNLIDNLNALIQKLNTFITNNPTPSKNVSKKKLASASDTKKPDTSESITSENASECVASDTANIEKA